MINRDPAHRYTDAEIVKLNSRLHEVYSEAYRDLDKKLKDFNERYRVKEAKYYKDLQDGKITQEQYNNWVKGQVFQGQRWQAKKDDIARTMYNANTVAANIVNNSTSNVFIQNGNYIGYALEHGAGVSFGFSLYDQNTVSRLLVSDPQLLPEWKIDEPKDYAWNYKNVQNSILQGTIQGERLDQISNRISKGLAMRNENTAKTFARTAMTGAQNAGRQTRLQEAVGKGLNVKKQWMATLDSHTRDSHADVDGEVVGVNEKFSNGLEYPGEPGGAPAEVYNCRCTMVGNLVEYPAEYKRYDNIAGKPIDSMTYREWENAKKNASVVRHVSAADFKWDPNYKGISGRQYGKADTSDALQEIQSGKSNSLQNYMDKDGNLSQEREALHRQIIDNYLAEKTPQQGTAVMTMMGGGPASGKSSVIKSGLYKLPDENHSITIDPDDIKQYLPGYLDMSKVDSTAASFYHEESSMLAKQLASTCFKENYNVTYDGTGDGSIGSVMKKLNGAKENGYTVNGMYVTVDIDEALKRNKSRYDHAVAKGESPRLVPDEYVINCHKKVTQISMDTSDKFDSISLYDNNGKSGETKLIAIGGSGKKLSAIDGEETAFKKYLDKVKYK